MKEKYKEMTAKAGKMETKFVLLEGYTMRMETTVRGMRPKNRKQKKLWKQEASAFKRDGNGTYSVTQTCAFNAKVLMAMLEHVRHDDGGEFYFACGNKEAKQ